MQHAVYSVLRSSTCVQDAKPPQAANSQLHVQMAVELSDPQPPCTDARGQAGTARQETPDTAMQTRAN